MILSTFLKQGQGQILMVPSALIYEPYMLFYTNNEFYICFKYWVTHLYLCLQAHCIAALSYSFCVLVSVINFLSLSDAIWHHRSWSPFVQVIHCCLMALSYNLNKCSLTISEILGHSHEGNLTKCWRYLSLMWIWKLFFLRLQPHLPGTNEWTHRCA